jgi:hypothetical protein
MRDWLREITTREIVGGLVVAVLLAGSGAVVGRLNEIGWFWVWTIAVFTFLLALLILTPFLGRMIEAVTGMKKIACFPRRSGIDWYVGEIKKAKHVSVLWHTGSILRDGGKLGEILPHLDRLLLPDPRGDSLLQALAEVSDETPDTQALADKIKKVTQDAQANKVEVRWWCGPTSNILTIADDWIWVEQFSPYLWATDRPRYKVDKHGLPETYEKLRQSYDRMWKESFTPEWSGRL